MAHAYTEAHRQFFAGHIEDRARLRPVECCGGNDCWVEFGPPAMNSQTKRCKGCDGGPQQELKRGYYAK